MTCLYRRDCAIFLKINYDIINTDFKLDSNSKKKKIRKLSIKLKMEVYALENHHTT